MASLALLETSGFEDDEYFAAVTSWETEFADRHFRNELRFPLSSLRRLPKKDHARPGSLGRSETKSWAVGEGCMKACPEQARSLICTVCSLGVCRNGAHCRFGLGKAGLGKLNVGRLTTRRRANLSRRHFHERVTPCRLVGCVPESPPNPASSWRGAPDRGRGCRRCLLRCGACGPESEKPFCEGVISPRVEPSQARGFNPISLKCGIRPRRRRSCQRSHWIRSRCRPHNRPTTGASFSAALRTRQRCRRPLSLAPHGS